MNISGSIVIVTGASSGIGEATARELARCGATVVLAARRVDDLNKLQAEIAQAGGVSIAIPTDVTDRAAIDQLVRTTIERYGRVDVLINNAGVSPGKLIDQAADEDMQRVLDVNLLAPARLVSAVVPYMKQQRHGIIINIGSVAGEVATSNLYAASKFGLRGLNDALRRELRHDGIAVVLIAPGFIRTAMTTGLGLPMPGPEVIAQSVVSAIRQPRRKLVVPWYYQPTILIAKLLPSFADALLGSNVYQRNYRNRKQLTQTQSKQK